MQITDEIFQAFLKCETKAYLKGSNSDVVHPEIADWRQRVVESYKSICCARLRSAFSEDECLDGPSTPHDFNNNRYRLLINCVVQTQGLLTRIPVLERLPTPERTKRSPLVPIRFVPGEKIAKGDKLLLAFDAVVLSAVFGKMPAFGKIIHGQKQMTTKVGLDAWVKTARSTIDKFLAQQASPPTLILNRHCTECEFRARCRAIALEKDDLSLLYNITEKERKQQHNKGIFTVTQLSQWFGQN